MPTSAADAQGWGDEHGLVAPIERTLVRGDADRALLEAAVRADVFVVGARGLGSGAGPLGRHHTA